MTREQDHVTNTNVFVVGGKLSKNPTSTMLHNRSCYLLTLISWHSEANQSLPIMVYCYSPEYRRILCQLREEDEVIVVGRLGYDIQKGQVVLHLVAHEIHQGDVTVEVRSNSGENKGEGIGKE
jgi:hypothetical protein